MVLGLTKALKTKMDESTTQSFISQPVTTGSPDQAGSIQKLSKSMINPGQDNEDVLSPSPNSQKSLDAFGAFFRKNKSLLHSTQMMNNLKSKVERMPTHQSLSIKTQGGSDDNSPPNKYDTLESPSEIAPRKTFFNNEQVKEKIPRESLSLKNQEVQEGRDLESEEETMSRLNQDFQESVEPDAQNESDSNKQKIGSINMKIEDF